MNYEPQNYVMKLAMSTGYCLYNPRRQSQETMALLSEGCLSTNQEGKKGDSSYL